MEIFGFEIKKSSKEQADEKNVKSFVAPLIDDGAMEVAAGGAYGTFIDLENTAKTEGDLVTRYREMSMQPECDKAIDDIVNDAIVTENETIEIILDDLEQPKNVKEKITAEFKNVLKLLDFNNQGYNLFRQWYVDGRLYHHIMIDEKNPRMGIKELRKIDPRKIKKVREKKIEIDPRTKIKLEKGYNEFYMYFPKGITKNLGYSINDSQKAIKIAADSICYTTSGLIDPYNKLVIGYIHKAIKPLNQLRMLEDATVIYRLARAPERRIFYIDVGNLPKMKAEQYLHDMMVKNKNKLVYDASTGEVRDDRKFMTMLEDFWLPRREGGKGTEITTLPGGQNLGEMDDVVYFRKKLYESLNVPVSRLEAESQFNLGRSAEITRDEVKFSKFISRLRNQFSNLFDDLLEIQLVLKGVVNRQQWKEFKEVIKYQFPIDNHFGELKEIEMMRERLSLANDIDPFIGRYFSATYVRKNIFRMTDEDIEKIDKEIEKERKESPELHGPNNPDAPESMTGQAMDMERDPTQPGVAKTPEDREKEKTNEEVLQDIRHTLNEVEKDG